MAFSKAPRVLITDEASVSHNPGPGDYNPKTLGEKKSRAATIYAEANRKELPEVTKPNYLKPKDTSNIAKLTKGSNITIPRRQLKQLEKENEQLKATLDAKSKEAASIAASTQQTLSENNSKLLEVTEERNEAKHQIKYFQSAIAHNTAELEKVQIDLNEAKQKHSATIEQLTTERDSQNKLSKQNCELELTIKGHEAAIEKYNSQIAQFQNELHESQHDLKTAQNEIENIKKTSEKRRVELEGRISQMKIEKIEKQDTFEKELKQVKLNIEALESTKEIEIQQLNDDIDDLKAENEKETQKYVSDISSHLSTISTLKEEIEAIQVELMRSNHRSEELTVQLSSEAELREEMALIADDNHKLRVELDVERDQLRELIELQIGYEDELSEHWAEILSQVDEIGRLQDSIEQMQTENTAICDRLRSTEQEKVNAEGKLETAQIEIEKLKQNSTAEAKKSDTETKYQKLKSSAIRQETVFHEKLAALRSKSEIDISNLRKIISDRERALTLKSDELTKSKGQLVAQESQIVFLKSSLDGLRIELHNEKCTKVNNADYKQKYEDLLEQMKLERATMAEYAEEKSILSDQNNKLSKSLAETEKKSALKMGHQNHHQKIRYMEKIKDENHKFREENLRLQREMRTQSAKMKIMDEQLRFQAGNPHLYSQ